MNTIKECRLSSLTLETDWCWISLRLHTVSGEVNLTDLAQEPEEECIAVLLPIQRTQEKRHQMPGFSIGFLDPGKRFDLEES